jgi:oxygen-dependent protoporphyrinogen oxidase
VGGGIAGLSLAHALKARGLRPGELVVLERSARVGGKVRSQRIDGYLCEWGANGFLDNSPPTLDLVRAIGLQDRLLPADPRAKRRYIFRDGRLQLVPSGPGSLLVSSLLTLGGKLRLLREPFAASPPAGDETIHAFATRRLGPEAADRLVDPIVSGIYAGDTRRLSLAACFPSLARMEADHGGLLRAMLAGRKAGTGAPFGRLTSFPEGVEELARALARAVGDAVRLESPVDALEPASSGYRLRVGNAGLEADSVVLAGPAAESARLLSALEPEAATHLAATPFASLATIALGFDERQLKRPLDGFGFLVPRSEKLRVLGVLWESAIYPGRAPAGRVLVRAMIGGTHDPDAVALDDATLLALVGRELAVTMQLDAKPVFTFVARHSPGLPQYTIGHLDRLAALERCLERRPGLHLAGNSYRGVAMNSLIAEAPALADRLLASRAP